MLTPLFLALFPLAPQEQPPAAPLEEVQPAKLVRVDLSAGELSVADLQRADFDIVYRNHQTLTVDLIVGEQDLARLGASGAEFTVVHEDLQAFYESRLQTEFAGAAPPSFGAWLTPPFGQGSMGGFYTLAELNSVIDQIVSAYPSIVAPKISIGTSIEGRPLWALQVTDNPGIDEGEPEVRFDALHHAREPQSMHALIWSLLSFVEGYGSDPDSTWIVDNRELWFVPCVNPDGYEYNRTIAPGGGGLWRKNRRNNGNGSFGVDLNRNYPFQWGFDNLGSSASSSSETYRGTAPASEPEVLAMANFLTAHNFVAALTCHSYSNVWLYPWGYIPQAPANVAEYVELSALQTEFNQYPAGVASILLYVTNGTTDDHDHGAHSTLSWTPEIGSNGDGFWPATSRIIPLAEENRVAFHRTALAVGAWVRVENIAFADAGNGNGFFEQGESVEVRATVRNSGKAGSGPVSLSLSSTSPFISFTGGSINLGPVASFTSANNNAQPASMTISGSAPIGTLIDVLSTITWDGYQETSTTQLVVGIPRPLLVDTLEVEFGWTAGLPGDTATTGLWEFGNPVGTSSSGVPSNPEDDATAAGVNCYTTGNGATSAGGDDVDNGFTTLISPRIDLGNTGVAVLSYARWYADLSTADDTFEVSISNDDGNSWTSLESVTKTANVWTPVSFVVNEIIAPTDRMRLRFVASDAPNNSIVEAAIDDLTVSIYDTLPHMAVYGTPTVGDRLAFLVTGVPNQPFLVYTSPGTANFQSPLFAGTLLIDPSLMFLLTSGIVPASGPGQALLTSPNDPALVGQTYHFQSLLVGGTLALSNRSSITFE